MTVVILGMVGLAATLTLRLGWWSRRDWVAVEAHANEEIRLVVMETRRIVIGRLCLCAGLAVIAIWWPDTEALLVLLAAALAWMSWRDLNDRKAAQALARRRLLEGDTVL